MSMSMAGAFLDHVVMRAQMHDLHVRKGRAEQLLGIHVLDLRRTSGLVLELLRPVALQEEVAAAPHRAFEAVEKDGALGRRCELDEDGDDEIEAPALPVPGEEVRLLDRKAHAALGGKAPRFRERDFGEVHRQHIEPLLGKPDAVAPLAIGDRERRLPAAQQMPLRDEERIGLSAEEIVVAGKPLVPAGAVGFVHVFVSLGLLSDESARESSC